MHIYHKPLIRPFLHLFTTSDEIRIVIIEYIHVRLQTVELASRKFKTARDFLKIVSGMNLKNIY
jgi:hypothetical protein